MTNKKTALVLGGTNPHIALIQNLRDRGYYTVLVDYYKNPPAKYAADEHVRESTLDKDRVCELAKQMNASLVISTCIDHANATACYVAEKLGLPRPYSYATAVNVTDKERMKKIMSEHGIPTSRYICIDDIAHFSGLRFPVVVKPSDSTGSKGVRKANTFEELSGYFLDAMEISRNKKVVVEEFVDGREIQIDCFVQTGDVRIVMTRQKNHFQLEGDFALQTIGSTIPANLSKKANVNIQAAATQIAKAFNLDNTPFFIQAKISEDDRISVIEFAPRVGGGLSFRLIELYSGVDFLDVAVKSFLTSSDSIEVHSEKCIVESVIVYAYKGIFDHIEGDCNLLDSSVVDEFYNFVTKGTRIGADMSTRSRVCGFIVKDDTRQALASKIRKALNSLKIHDIDGNDIMRKDLYDCYELGVG